MDRRRNLLIGFVVAIVLVSASVVASGYSKRLLRGLQIYPVHKLPESATAPDLATGAWINSEPLTVKDLRGRVVMIDFWTFGCYNCRNTLPFIKNMHNRYGDKGLTVVGVHSPEFDHEKEVETLRSEVGSLDIHYPVVSDNDFKTWDAYGVAAWPTVFLVDKQGRIRWKHVGEGSYAEMDRVIQNLLAE